MNNYDYTVWASCKSKESEKAIFLPEVHIIAIYVQWNIAKLHFPIWVNFIYFLYLQRFIRVPSF